QLPPSFHFTPGRLADVAGALDPARRNVVEFRHESWWDDRVFAALKEVGAIFCSCSGPKLPDDLVTTADEVYVRFHGPEHWYRHDYAKAELAAWVEKVRAAGPKRVWAYFNNDQHAHAVKNARTLGRLLSAALEPKVT